MVNWDFNDNNMYNGKYNDDKPCEKKNDDKKNDCCCCSGSFRKALSILSDPTIANYINFDQFAFVGKQISVGGILANIIGTAATNTPSDNLFYTVGDDAVGFQCVDCDLVRVVNADEFYLVRNDVTGAPPDVAGTPIEVPLDYLPLCDLVVVKFPVDDEAFTTTTAINECLGTCTISSWTNFKAYIRSLLDKKEDMNKNNCKTTCDNCCCTNGILNQVNSCVFGSRGSIVNLTAGSFFGLNLEVLGKVGCVLVLTDNNTNADGAIDPNIFLVCLNDIGGFSA